MEAPLVTEQTIMEMRRRYRSDGFEEIEGGGVSNRMTIARFEDLIRRSRSSCGI